ncbi:MAG: PAAR-like domain-containing protein [Hyphomicrobiales bacterium]
MFALCQGKAMQMAPADVCKTAVGPAVVPMPYPNISYSASATSVVGHVLFEGLPAVTQAAKDAVSTGDEAGASGGGGVVSSKVCGQTTYIKGCSTIFVGGAPLQRLTSVTGQNAEGGTENAVGGSYTPAQTTVLTLG